MDGICLKLKAGSDVPAETLLQALDFIRNFADRYHHAREEEYLFPALEQAGFGKEGGALSFLQAEHRIERELLAELELTVEEYQYGDDAAAQHFVKAADNFCTHLIGHMQKEDKLLFRIAEEMLDEEAKTELLRCLSQTSFGNKQEGIQKYEHLATELENNWTV